MILADQSHEIITFDTVVFRDYFHRIGRPELKLDFAKVDFGNNKLRFINCSFQDFEIDLSNTTFIESDLLFEDCGFFNSSVDLSDCKFQSGSKHIKASTFKNSSFISKNANFGDGDFKFEAAKFENQSQLDCSGAEFDSGDLLVKFGSMNDSGVEFSNAKLGEGSFKMQIERTENSQLHFHECEFPSLKTDFSSLTLIGSRILANGAKFVSNEVDFSECELQNSTIDLSSNATLSTVFQSNTASFSYCKLSKRSKLDLSRSNFKGNDIELSESKVFGSIIDFSDFNFDGRYINFHHLSVESDETFLSTFNLEKAKISAQVVNFSSSMFRDANFSADGLNFHGKIFTLEFMKFKGDSLFELTGSRFNCDQISLVSADIELHSMYWELSTLSADTITFTNTKFEGKYLSFFGTNFNSRQLDLTGCSWSGTELDFKNASFQGDNLNFERNSFNSEFSNFKNATFAAKQVKFDNSKFAGRASFADIKDVRASQEFSFQHCVFENSFDLSSREKFGCVVDLTRTKMSNQFSLEYVKCEINTSTCKTFANSLVWPIKCFVPKKLTLGLRRFILNREWLSKHRVRDERDIERLRRLKQIAGDNKSSRQALYYRVKETQAERWNPTSYADLFFEFFFQMLSDYGRSEARVGFWLMVNLGGFAALYAHLAITQTSFWEKLKPALAYSLSHIFAFIPISRTSREDYGNFLFGTGDLPLSIIMIASAQSLFSVLLLFLLGLSLRNRFKI